MAPNLRVNPPVLRDVAAEEKAVADAAANTGASPALADAAAGVAGLLCADGCQSVRTALDAASQSVRSALQSHSEKVDSAAQQYEATDAAFSSRLQQFRR